MFDIKYMTAVFILSSSLLVNATQAPLSSSHAPSASSHAPSASIRLTSETMQIVRKLIDLRRMEEMHEFRSDIYNILYGKKTADGTRKGDYVFEGVHYSVHGLCEQEELLEATKGSLSLDVYNQKKHALNSLLEQAKAHFKEKGEKFRGVSNTKKIMAALFEESLSKRNRLDSKLFLWIQSRCDEDEEKIFQLEVLTFKVYAEFLTDLHNILGDIIESCPEMNQQYETKVKKFFKICHLSKECVQKNEPLKPFISFVRNNYLDKLKLEEITPEKMRHLYDLYKKQK